jgi:cytochrome c oxidase cbb3-type subunit 3
MAAAGALALALAGCGAKTPNVQSNAPSAQSGPGSTAVSGLFPGGGRPAPPDPHDAQYENNPAAIAAGQRLFGWYNCSGCHSNGGGNIGPPLMDDKWRYGGSIDQIYASIYQGRPNGMPSWAGKIPDGQIWQIASFVRSLSAKNNPAIGLEGSNKASSPVPPPAPDAVAADSPEAQPQTVTASGEASGAGAKPDRGIPKD